MKSEGQEGNDVFTTPSNSLSSVEHHKRSNSAPDSLRRIAAEAVEASFPTGVANLYDDGLDEDDSSYLEDSERHPAVATPVLTDSEIEQKKRHTVEQIYWPFHRLYDIHGHRRIIPLDSPSDNDSSELSDYKIPEFVPPLSDRKDGGLMMDTEGLNLPMRFQGPNGVHLYEGKIFYMGIIDILQDYNFRKSFETRYHQNIQRMDRWEASCVHPRDYADRFLAFFDEYSQRKEKGTPEDEEGKGSGFEVDEAGEPEEVGDHMHSN